MTVQERFPHFDPEIPPNWTEQLVEDFPEIADAIGPAEELLADKIRLVRSDARYRSKNMYLRQIDRYNLHSYRYIKEYDYQKYLTDEAGIGNERYLREELALPDVQRRFELALAFREAGNVLGDDENEYQADPLMPLKMSIALRLIRPMPKKDISDFTVSPTLSGIATNIDTVAAEMNTADRDALKERTSEVMSGLIKFLDIAEQPYLTNAQYLTSGFISLERARRSKSFLVDSYQHIPKLSSGKHRRLELYGVDSLEPDEIIDGLERAAASHSTNRSRWRSLEERCLEMVLGTLRVTGNDLGSENAKKLHDVLVNNKTKVKYDSPIKTITMDNYIQLANGLIGTINNVRNDNEPPLEKLASSIRNLPEAFRRIMYVAMDGDEADPRATQLELNKRFTAIDLLAELMDKRLEHEARMGRTAIGTQNRGSVRTKGQTFWRRWQPGFGTLS